MLGHLCGEGGRCLGRSDTPAGDVVGWPRISWLWEDNPNKLQWSLVGVGGVGVGIQSLPELQAWPQEVTLIGKWQEAFCLELPGTSILSPSWWP